MRTVETKKIMFAVLAAVLVATLASVSHIESVLADHNGNHVGERGCDKNNTCGTVGDDPDTNEADEEEREARDAQDEADEEDPD